MRWTHCFKNECRLPAKLYIASPTGLLHQVRIASLKTARSKPLSAERGGSTHR